MKIGEYVWDTPNELRTRCELSLKLHTGHLFFTAGKAPLATATLMADGKTLDITIRYDRIMASSPNADMLNRLTDRCDMVLRGVAEQTELFGLVDEAKEVLKAPASKRMLKLNRCNTRIKK